MRSLDLDYLFGSSTIPRSLIQSPLQSIMQDDDTHLKQRKHFAAAILGNYFHFITIVLSAGAWLLAFAAQIVVTKTAGRAAVGVMWFAVFLQLFLIFGVLTIIACGEVGAFRLQVCVFGVMAASFAVIGVDMSIFTGQASRSAMGAGWLVLAIIDILWVLYFSSDPGTPLARLVDSLTVAPRARNHDRRNGNADLEAARAPSSRSAAGETNYDSADMTSDGSPDETKVGHERSAPSPEASADWSLKRLDRKIVDRSQEAPTDPEPALETEKPPNHARSPPPSSKNRQAVYIDEHRHLSTIYDNTESGASGNRDSQRDSDHLYPFKVRARSDWIPRSPSEISFKKGDILHSAEKDGKKWWKVRKTDGSVGTAPSNYFKVVNN
ncbi:hypothetical protein C8R44DRAFT_23376 [Mycena epipterygia]|nr:hypothetical protein C8R44DRAFT_23376 [Mycena epipterygia]